MLKIIMFYSRVLDGTNISSLFFIYFHSVFEKSFNEQFIELCYQNNISKKSP